MSADLYVRPIRTDGERLPKKLRDIFREKVCNGWTWVSVDRSYIVALRDAGIEGAERLLEIYDESGGGIEMKIEN